MKTTDYENLYKNMMVQFRLWEFQTQTKDGVGDEGITRRYTTTTGRAMWFDRRSRLPVGLLKTFNSVTALLLKTINTLTAYLSKTINTVMAHVLKLTDTVKPHVLRDT